MDRDDGRSINILALHSESEYDILAGIANHLYERDVSQVVSSCGT